MRITFSDMTMVSTISRNFNFRLANTILCSYSVVLGVPTSVWRLERPEFRTFRVIRASFLFRKKQCFMRIRNSLFSIFVKIPAFQWLSNTNIITQLAQNFIIVNRHIIVDGSSIGFEIKRRVVQKDSHLLPLPRIFGQSVSYGESIWEDEEVVSNIIIL